MAEWCCPSCAAAAGAPALYPPGAVSELVRQLPRIGAPSANDETCSVPEAAKLFHTTPDSVYAMHSRGQLPETIGPGRRLVWRKSDLLECSAKRVSSPGRRTRR
jgi:predicted DNA-binding transcriptional regulator AlpA